MNESTHAATVSHLDPEQEQDVFDEMRRLKPVDPRDFKFMKLSRRVCLIRRKRGADATGFLVGPDLMLTAAHALMGTSAIFADPDDVTVLFDQFIWNRKKQRRAKGDSCGLRILPFSNPKQPDVVASSIKVNPQCTRRFDDNKLDYILVRLDRPMGLAFLPYSHRIRGWNNCSRANAPAAGDVIVVQHPQGDLLQVAEGSIPPAYEVKDFPQFFRYNTLTFPGSSGAPVFDPQRRVVGMHIGEISEKEQLGVSFQKIFEDLKKEGVKLPPFRLTREVMDSIFGSSNIERERRHGDWRGDRLFDDIEEDD